MNASQIVARVLATWFGCGYWPWGPGTVGSAAAVLIAIGFHHYLGIQPWILGLVGVLTLPLSIWASGAEAVTSGRKDPQHVVLDEVIGQWITLSPVMALDWKLALTGFVLFRLFDIWKPPPARQMESLPGGVGIMADDVMAGVYGAVVMAITGSLHF
ncbi:MAG: phosphatidylglycerophosphatase A [Bryobacteraceae bacterium]|nr:phosphatidylglycerophosphatase A [Bryobacteraceae bacterium]